MTALFDFKKKEKEFVMTLTKHEKVSDLTGDWMDDEKIHGITLNKREAKAVVQLIKEEFLMEGVSIKKVDPDTFEIHAQMEKRTPDYCDEDDWEDVMGAVRWVFGEYCGNRSCEQCPFNIGIRDCVAIKVFVFYRE